MDRQIRRALALAGLALVTAVGCGDNALACGPGTADVDGVCTPETGEPPSCADGTILDVEVNACVLDPSACQGGTALIDGACKDPSAGQIVDVLEGAEPNGRGLGGEDSVTPAGLLNIKPAGEGVILVQGAITPHPDRDGDGQPEPDFDTYFIDVATPTLLAITVDGVGGLAGGFAIAAEASELAGWRREGIALSGDTAHRQVYLPAAGRYLLAFADARSLVLGTAVGDAGTGYYATIEKLALPAVTDLVPAAGAAHAAGTLGADAPRLYSVALGSGINQVSLVTAHPTQPGSVVVVVEGVVRGIADERKAGTALPATVEVSGLAAGATAVIAVEPQRVTAAAPVAFELDVAIGP